MGLYVDLYVSDSCLMKKQASTAPPHIQYYILHLLNGCSTINSFDYLVRKWRPSGVGCICSPSGSNAKNKNKSPMLIPILFHEVIINKCIYHGFYFVHLYTI